MTTSPLLRGFLEKSRFALVCLYLASQVFMVPLFAIGPSWAVWPTLSDIAAVLMVPLLLIDSNFQPCASHQNRNLWRIGLLITFGCLVSYAALASGLLGSEARGKGIVFGLLQTVRLFEFLVVWHVSANILLTGTRIRKLRRISLFVFLGIAAGVLLTFFGVVPTQIAGSHLPSSLGMAGPWAFYVTGSVDQGVGFVGYNHGYTAAQLLMAAALCLHLGPRKFTTRCMVIGLLMLTTYLTGARSGLLCATAFVILLEAKRPFVLLVGLGMVGVLALGLMATGSESIDRAWARQNSTADSYQQDGFSGRTGIWKEKVDFLSAQPVRWIVGGGFGSAVETGPNAHMLCLQIVLELGFVGLFVFAIFQYNILKYLFSCEGYGKPLFWLTIALLFGSLTQETFYPVVAFSHLLGFYVCIIAIGCGRKPGAESKVDGGPHMALLHRLQPRY